MAKIQTAIIGLMLNPKIAPIPARPKITAIFKTATRGIRAVETTTAKEAKRAERGRRKREKTIWAPLKIISHKKPRKKNRRALPLFTAKKIKRKTKTAKI